MGTQMSSPATSPRAVRLAIEDLGPHLTDLEHELSDAGSIVLTRGERAVAEIRVLEPEQPEERRPFNERMPDFAARLKEMWGDRLSPDSTPLIRADRDGE